MFRKGVVHGLELGLGANIKDRARQSERGFNSKEIGGDLGLKKLQWRWII
jgi:hypothetical protein